MWWNALICIGPVCKDSWPILWHGGNVSRAQVSIKNPQIYSEASRVQHYPLQSTKPVLYPVSIVLVLVTFASKHKFVFRQFQGFLEESIEKFLLSYNPNPIKLLLNAKYTPFPAHGINCGKMLVQLFTPFYRALMSQVLLA